MRVSNIFSLNEVCRILFRGEVLKISEETWAEIDRCFGFLQNFTTDKVIYGINTGFGPMAQWRIEDHSLKELQYNIIRSHSTGAGKPVEPLYVKAAMIARLGTFLQARSGVHRELVELLVEFINRGIYR